MQATFVALPLSLLFVLACGADPESPTPDAPADEPTFLSLSQRFASARIENAVEPTIAATEPQWMFSDGSDHGWQALHDVSAFGVRDGRLAGSSGALPLLISPTPENLDTTDLLHAVEIRIQVSAGGQIGVDFDSEDELDPDALIARALDNDRAMLSTELLARSDGRRSTLILGTGKPRS